jgi:hypothetical protein
MSALRITIVILGILVAISIGADMYVRTEFVDNKGPDDFGAISYAYHDLGKRYGSRDGKASLQVIEFKKQASGKNGLYEVTFDWNSKEGVLLIDYSPDSPHFESEGVQLSK